MLNSLHKGFALFRANYYMNDMKKTPHELHSLLVQTEKDMKLSGSIQQDVLTISNKGKGKGKAQGNLTVGKPKFKKPGNGKSGPGETSSSQGKTKSKHGDVNATIATRLGIGGGTVQFTVRTSKQAALLLLVCHLLFT